MSAHVLLNLLNEWGKRDKMRGLPSILSFFRNEFNKFNNTRARMLDSIDQMTHTLKSHFWRKNIMIVSSCTQLCHMGQYQLLSVLSARLSPLNIDHSRNLPVEICGINYTEKYTNL